MAVDGRLFNVRKKDFITEINIQEKKQKKVSR
jgi:hypothetical protein